MFFINLFLKRGKKLRRREHNFTLPQVKTERFKRSYVNKCLFNYFNYLLFIYYYLLKLYLFRLIPSAIADFQGGRDNKKKTIYIMQIKTVKLKYDGRID